jgi:hypothetical protein
VPWVRWHAALCPFGYRFLRVLGTLCMARNKKQQFNGSAIGAPAVRWETGFETKASTFCVYLGGYHDTTF